MNLALIGPRGAGKTRISNHLNRMLKWPVFSTDALISYEAGGKPIPELIAAAGGDWRDFRDREYEVLAKASRMDGVIIDCGGGIVVDLDDDGNEICSERKVELLRERAVVFFLHPPFEQVQKKIEGDPNRPRLSDRFSAEEIQARRLPWYRRAAHHELAVQKGERREAAEEIIRLSGAEKA